ncbi:MAG: glycosylhydrolase-like jelly roll fold domain-containing protein, partial [Acidobacteriota bacterium]
WNEVLVKVGKARAAASGFFGFTFRVADARGFALPNIAAATYPRKVNQRGQDKATMRWYRIRIPPGCVGVVPPSLRHPFRMSLNGHALTPSGGAPINFSAMLQGEDNTLVIVAQQDDPVVAPIVFVTGVTPFSLESWTRTGLENFSGAAIYTKTFTLPAGYRGERLMLDLGRVSSVAQVVINGSPAGTLVWNPYRIDITRFVKPGINRIEVLVTNTEANQRAVGTSRHILSAIDLDGLEGPVRVIPYIDQMLTLYPSSADGRGSAQSMQHASAKQDSERQRSTEP